MASDSKSPFSKKLYWFVVLPLIITAVTMLSTISEAFAFWGAIGLLGLVALITVVWWVVEKRKKPKTLGLGKPGMILHPKRHDSRYAPWGNRNDEKER